ncbi:Eco57I restriction-modification methylase domain-containing protein [Candidatus Poriferisocius sp.]|uniref:Eco57I restriction-modification methylase domain-containing protein n=1 Tax=Candidatus Poriferisocius sp. TaxID=3101276 RepID=UPI003B027E19
MDRFLIDRNPVNWAAPEGFPPALTPAGAFFQDVSNGLEVVLVRASSKPTAADMRRGWFKRRERRPSPVLLVAFYPGGDGELVTLCGPVGEQPVVHYGIEVTQAERLADVALSEPSHHAATRFLLAALPELDSPFPGLRNLGLLATQELKAGVPQRPDWDEARRKAQPLLARRARRLVEGLGFQIEPLVSNASKLIVNGRDRAVAVFCEDDEPFEAPSRRFDTSPVSRALALADRENIDWVILTRASEIRLYSSKTSKSVGGKGRAETFVEVNLTLLPRDLAGYLQLLFSAEALADGGTLDEILNKSRDFAADLAVRLQERVYRKTVPALANAVAARLSPGHPGGEQVLGEGDLSNAGRQVLSEDDLNHAYEQVMVILFRLLFVAYAEDKDLLPYRTNDEYAKNSLSQQARHLAEQSRHGPIGYDRHETGLWDRVSRLWQAVNEGNAVWGVPAYNGGLFSADPAASRSGAAISRLTLTDAEFGPALEAVLVDEGPEGVGPVDFRSLSVREFGTIYEGLLESRLSVAQDDLTIKTIKGDEQYVPAAGDDEVEVEVGSVYFHNSSGARKATGSYFTKPFAVEHLLDHALEPALDDHIARLEELRLQNDDAGVAEAFFDFRCADIAMGSAHFLVAAVDRIEARLSAWLTLNRAPAITEELKRLRRAAVDALGDLADGVEIETSSLLRRQVARHCVYGIDKIPVAVELARLSIWIHTFVPGLPLSFLDHNLVRGDCLTGVASIDDAAAALMPKQKKAGEAGYTPSLFARQLEQLLEGCGEHLAKLGRLNDANKAEIDAARQANEAARQAAAPASAVFNVVTAVRAGAIQIPKEFDFTPEKVAALDATSKVQAEVQRFIPVHYPAVWPEVFARGERSGFDCLLGNPPWEKVVVDRKVWWGMHLPGVRSLPTARMRMEIDTLEARRPDLAEVFEEEKERAEAFKKLLRATFPKLGSGQTDLYKAFSWANLGLCRLGGRIGNVLPRTAVADAGMANWRNEVLGVPKGTKGYQRVPKGTKGYQRVPATIS